ncbi:MAG TPA: hypothetical protein VK177_13145 [Flavobacteriales bacterium]|nr:hypothetical protein [Flavobacteriales bacterium]
MSNMQAEPKTVLRFLVQYFDVIEELLQEQRKEGFIKSEVLARICSVTDIRLQLAEYRILTPVKSDWEIRKVYEDFLSFIIGDQRITLPETIEKYHDSITKLFLQMQYTDQGDLEILGERITELQEEVKHLTENVETNTNTLLKETRELKANVERIDYLEKVKKACYWIDYYIVPLNKILDINKFDSVASKLYEVSFFANEKRLTFPNEPIRLKYEKLYEYLILVNDELLRHSKILTHELMPLIERIKTESLILSGFIQFLKKPNKYDTPPLLKDKRVYIYNKNVYFNTLEYFEQFYNQEDVVYEEDASASEKWVFNMDRYKETLRKKLPLDNFFEWASKELDYEFREVESEKFFSLCTLLFEEDIKIEVDEEAKRQRVHTMEAVYMVPRIKIEKI